MFRLNWRSCRGGSTSFELLNTFETLLPVHFSNSHSNYCDFAIHRILQVLHMYVFSWYEHILQNVTCEHSTFINQQMFLCLWCPSKIIQCCRQISWYISDDYPKTTMKIQLNSQMPKESKHLKAQACYNISSPHSSGPFSENTSNRSLSRCPLSKARTPLPSVSQMWVPAMAHNASKDPQEYNN